MEHHGKNNRSDCVPVLGCHHVGVSPLSVFCWPRTGPNSPGTLERVPTQRGYLGTSFLYWPSHTVLRVSIPERNSYISLLLPVSRGNRVWFSALQNLPRGLRASVTFWTPPSYPGPSYTASAYRLASVSRGSRAGLPAHQKGNRGGRLPGVLGSGFWDSLSL